MRCKNCPAYWETKDYFVSYPEEFGCYCEPEKGNDFGRMFKNGEYGCNRKIEYIRKVMNRIKEELRKVEEIFLRKE